MAMHEDDRDRVSRQGTEAWRRLKREKNWNDWLKVGEALLVGRDWAQNQAQTNRPQGKAYNMAFGEWLQRYKLDDMDKGDRSRLYTVMENLPMIEDWRRTLTLNQKLSLNHPNAVLRRWKAHMAPEPRTESGEPKPTLRDSVANLTEANDAKDREIEQLKARTVELEEELAAAREPTTKEGRAPESLDEARAAYVRLVVQAFGTDKKAIKAETKQLNTELAMATLDTVAAGPATVTANVTSRHRL
jgi:hypothetical protein